MVIAGGLTGVIGLRYLLYIRDVHTTFEKYYQFRGCVKLLDKTDNYGDCQLVDGTKIKLVKFNNKWYLDGDLPVCWFFGKCI